MIIKGKSASHGRYLKGYLISKRDNDIDPEVFKIKGTATPDSYDLSANEIALSGLLSRGDKNIYHAIINPSTNDRSLTDEEWHTSIDKLLEGLGYQDQKHIAVKHVKDDREHMHLMVDRYSYELNKLLPDGNNYYIHQDVAAELEQLFGHEQTPRQSIYSKDRAKETKLSHHKDILTDLWNGTTSGQDFLEQAESLGYHVGAGLEKRPFKVVLPDGRSVDLVRQLKDIKLADVYERINPKELPNEADVIKLVTDEIKMQRELAEQEFLRNLEDEQFLAHTEGRNKEKKQIAELEADMARAAALENQEVMHSKSKKLESLRETLVRHEKERLEFVRNSLEELEYLRFMYGSTDKQPDEAKRYFSSKYGLKVEQEMNKRHMDELYGHRDINNHTSDMESVQDLMKRQEAEIANVSQQQSELWEMLRSRYADKVPEDVEAAYIKDCRKERLEIEDRHKIERSDLPFYAKVIEFEDKYVADLRTIDHEIDVFEKVQEQSRETEKHLDEEQERMNAMLEQMRIARERAQSDHDRDY